LHIFVPFSKCPRYIGSKPLVTMFTHGYKKCLIQLDSDISAHILQFEVYKGNWNVKNLTLYIVTNGLDPIYLGHWYMDPKFNCMQQRCENSKLNLQKILTK
jgi:hypothetical protein